MSKEIYYIVKRDPAVSKETYTRTHTQDMVSQHISSLSCVRQYQIMWIHWMFCGNASVSAVLNNSNNKHRSLYTHTNTHCPCPPPVLPLSSPSHSSSPLLPLSSPSPSSSPLLSLSCPSRPSSPLLAPLPMPPLTPLKRTNVCRNVKKRPISVKRDLFYNI